MAFTLSKANIAQGNIIQPADVSQSIDALTGLYAYRIAISGSLNLTGSTVTGSTANFTSVTASLFGTGSWAVSSSRAISSSYSIGSTSADAASTVVNQEYEDGTSIKSGTFKFVAGNVTLSGGVGSSSAFSQLPGKIIGTNAFITATYADGFTFGGSDPANLMTSITPDGKVAIIQQSPSTDNGTVLFTGIYI
jgi:hypothetical protein